MKNKKLFAILTLVCFMLTLMPVAAFAAAPENATVITDGKDAYAELVEDGDVVESAGNVVFNLTNITGGNVYVIAVADKKAVKANGTMVQEVIVDTDKKTATAKAPATGGTYTFYVVDKNEATANIVAKFNGGELNNETAVANMLERNNVNNIDTVVTVKDATATAKIGFVEAAADTTPVETLTAHLRADSGYEPTPVYVKLVSTDSKTELTGKALVGKEVTISTNSNAIAVDADKVTTNAAGVAKIKISGFIAGTYEVYATYDTDVTATLKVTVDAMGATNIETVVTPDAPVATGTKLEDVDIAFKITDANGNNVGVPATGVYKVVATEKPATVKFATGAITLTAGDNGPKLKGATLDTAGTYTFKVSLNNGNFATASVEVKKFATPVELTVSYPVNAIELGNTTAAPTVKFVDAYGVTRAPQAGEVKLTATGHAVKTFGDDGKVTVKSDEKYVGSAIKVLAVSQKYNLIGSADLVVANEAAAVKYASTKADIAVNNTITANIVDVDGNKVALNDGNFVDISYVVLEKPENAKVAISTVNGSEKVTKGEFKVSFTASQVGTYKVQTVVKYVPVTTDAANNKQELVKYYSGIEEITVGNTGIKDVVVMSVGSNEIVINAEKSTIDAAPIVKESRVFVPFRAMAEAFGATVDFDETTQAVTAELNGTTVVMTIGSATYTINGVEKTMDVAPFIAGDRTMIPVRFAVEAFGIKVTPTFDENGATADVLFAK